MKRTNKKGFTIVELVIVIAVIAILAAVLIPTFSGIIKKANISSDTQLCKNMNTALDVAKAEGSSLDTMEEVLFAINEAGYVVENLNPTTEGHYFAWDSKNEQIVFLNEKFGVHYPKDATIDNSKCWITAGSAAEADKIAKNGFAVYLEPGVNGDIALTSLVNVDAGVNTVNSLSIDSNANGSISINGKFNNVTLNVPNADVAQNGVINDLDVVAVKVGTLKVNGYVKNISITAGKVMVNHTGIIGTVESGADKIDTANSKGVIIDQTVNYSSPDQVTIINKTELFAFRDAVNGGYNYAGKTVILADDIDLSGIAWLPIGNVFRKVANLDSNITGFAGTFNGKGHTISNLSNYGFTADGIASGRFADTKSDEDEVVFGLFGCVMNATIKNLTVTANIDDFSGEYKGDSIAAIVGYAYGETFTIENCKASGSVVGVEGVGGLVGRSYAHVSTLKNCVNAVNVTITGRHGAGLIGFVSNNHDKNGIGRNNIPLTPNMQAVVNIEGCTNTGIIDISKSTEATKVSASVLVAGGNVKVNATIYNDGNKGVNEIPA